MLSLLGFLLILAPLVVVHELGHFLFAKLFGVKAEVFSIGFGPRLWAKKIGETEFRLAAIPLGGFVKLLGEEPGTELSPEDKPRALQAQRPRNRFWIFFGGPLFNFIWAAIVFMAIFAIGEPQLASVIGRVVPGSEAAALGFQSGDEVLSVNGEPVKKYEEVLHYINEHPNQEVAFEIKNPNRGDGSPQKIVAKITQESGLSMYGEQKTVGKLDGIISTPRGLKIGISNDQSPAAKAGLKSGMFLVSLQGQTLTSYESFEMAYQKFAPGEELTLEVRKSMDAKLPTEKITLPKVETRKDPATDFGIHSSELFVEQAVPDMPAVAAGIKDGDRIVSIDGVPVHSFFTMKDAIQAGGEKNGKIRVQWERNGVLQDAEIVPKATTERDLQLKKVTQYSIGVAPGLVFAESATIVERIWNPFVLVYKGFERMLIFTYRNFVSIGKMFTGDVSVSTLGGPILIGKLAGESLSRGIISFLSTMAMLSVGLGILNVLPVPVLDGGHLVLLGLEVIRKKPLTVRQMEVVQQVGLSLILLLMVVVMKNDISRLPIFK